MKHYILLTLLIFVDEFYIVSPSIGKSILNQLKKRKKDNIEDLNRCRVTHSGVEYEGNIAQTKTGIMCQNWETNDPIHPVAEQIVDADFPEGSKKTAKNFCRNPRHWLGRPWCYTLDFNIPKEECIVPLCSKKECRITGPGVEYSGKIYSSGSRECVFWSDVRGPGYKDIMYDSLFPDGTRKNAQNRCRNPDSDVGGPWCLVHTEFKNDKTNDYEKGYCSVPLCDIKPCMIATASVSSGFKDFHTVFSVLPLNSTSIDFSVRLWQPEVWQSGELRLALCSFPIPSTGTQMRSWKTGVEIVISTYRSGVTPAEGVEEPDWNVEKGLLSGTRWRDLELSWAGGFISLKIKGKTMAIFTKDFTENEKDLTRESFKYYSIKGSNALWNFPFCSSDIPYEEHVTTHGDFERRWPLLKTAAGLECTFFIKGFHTAIIELKTAAMLQYPSVQITLRNVKNYNKTMITLKESAEDERVTLEEVSVDSIISFWEWREFLLNIDGPRLELYWVKDSKQIKVMSVIHPRLELVKWFAIGSRQSTVHWAIGVSPPVDKLKLPAELPECVMSPEEMEYGGHQTVSATGLTCLPWNDQTGKVTENLRDSDFVDGSKLDAKNYCRNPSASPEGPYCYAGSLSDSGNGYVVGKANCEPRLCRSKECRMSGTGNDYIGTLGETVSGRMCQRWLSKNPHTVSKSFLDNEMFPELSLSNASNFCRNPSHDSAGLWCYTDDPLVETDVCDVPDCEISRACIVIVKGNETKQSVFILPLWRTNGLAFKVKSWDPKRAEGVRFIIGLSKDNTRYSLDLGAGNNDRIILNLIYSNGTEVLLKQKTVARVVPSGHWAGFVIELKHGEIGLKYENVPSVFFHWKHTFSQGIEPLHPKLISYSALGNYAAGLYFSCEECHTHVSQTGIVQNAYPLNLWKPNGDEFNNTNITINVRGTGSFIITLSKLLDDIADRIVIKISDFGEIVVRNKDATLAELKNYDQIIFNNKSWTSFSLKVTEKILALSVGNTVLVSYNSSTPLLYYYYSLSVADGTLFWAANCEPPNIDAPPVNGGWSNWGPWDCSVTCGGGHGKRYRKCDHPKPNLFGEPCTGPTSMEGPCNDFKCGDVPPVLYEKMSERILTKAHNIRARVGDNVTLQCDSSVLSELKDASPKTYVEWLKDGVQISKMLKLKKIDVDNFTISKQEVQFNDSGIYICGLEDRKGRRAVIQMSALTVVTNASTKTARKGSTMVLDCQSTALTFLFNDLTQFWTLNGGRFDDSGASSHSLLDVDILSPITEAHEGEWECTVAQVQHNLTWTTGWFRLRINSNSALAVTFDKLFIGLHFKPFGTHVIANSIFALFLFVFIVIIVTCCILLLISLRKKRTATRTVVKVKKYRSISKSGKITEYQELDSS